MSAQVHPLVGPHSRAIDRGSIGWSLDGRSREGRFLRAYEAQLVQHVGGTPSRVQRELIRRCARLALHLELQDEKLLAGETPSDHASRQYLAWNGALVRTLRQVGLRGAAEKPPSLAEYLASREAAARAQPSAGPGATEDGRRATQAASGPEIGPSDGAGG